MIAVSNDFKNAMKQPVKELQAYINDIKSADDLISFKISCETGLCKTAMRKLEGKYTGEHNLLGQWVHAGFGVKLPSGAFEYLEYGSFLVTEMTHVKDTGVTTIVGYDKMINSMTPYVPLNIEYPISLIDYTKLLCNACNLELDNEGFTYNLYNDTLLSKLSTYKEPMTEQYYRGYKYQLTPNSTYTVKVTNNGYKGDYGWIYAVYDSNKELIGKLQEGAKSEDITVTFTTDDTGVIYFTHLYATQERLDTWFSTVTIQLEKGVTIHDYVPYNPMKDWLITKELWENIEGITYRDIFVQIAQATGTTCIISNDKVYFKSLTATGEQLTYDNMFKLKLEPKYGEINSIVLSRTPQEDNIYMRDETSVKDNGLTEFKIENNEIIDKDRDNAMTPIYEALKGISYYPFESTTEGLGWYEIGDKLNIVNDMGDVFNTALFNLNITIDGSIKEILKTVAETKTQTQYQYATTIAKRVKNTEIIVNKQEQYIESLVSDVYSEKGIINENFTKIYQDIHNIVNNVQNSGGGNLIKNSVMFAYDGDKVNDWDISYGGKNLLDYVSHFLPSNGGLTNTINPDGSITITGKPTSSYVSIVNRHYINDILEHGQRYRLYEKNYNAEVFIEVRAQNKTDGSYKYHQRNTNFTVDLVNYDYTICVITGLDTTWGTEDKTITNYWQLEKGDSFTGFEPYLESNIIIDSNTESLSAGGLSGHSFTLRNKKASQKVLVNTNSYYSFSTKIKKGLDGSCYVRLYNANEEYIIELKEGEEAFYKEYEIKSLSPKDNYYIIEFYGSADSDATFTDNMLSLGEYKSQWTQANGEIMNTQVNVNLNGVLVKSSVYLGDYTVMSPLEFAGYSNINGTITKVFTLNKDVTYMTKAEVKDEFRMVPIKIVPITTGDLQGWAFVPSIEEV